MMPYPNPNYYSNANPAFNQFMNQYQQPNYVVNPYANNQYVQQAQANNIPVTNTINGRIVDDFNMITANDVPMDGNVATFIKKDGTEIQTRSWTANGTIATISYKPVIDTVEQNKKSEEESNIDILTHDMKSFMEEINGRFDKLEKSLLGRNGRVKKEVSEEE